MNQHIRFNGDERFIPKHGPSSEWEGQHDIFLDLHGKYGEGRTTTVSKQDEPLARSHEPWYGNKDGYAVHSRGKKHGLPKTVSLHRLLRGHPSKKYVVDHFNSVTTDNRQSNLKTVSRSANNTNKRSKSRSGYKGVTQQASGRFDAKKNYQGVVHHLGTFDTAEEASQEYIQFCSVIGCPVHESKIKA